MKRIRWLIGLFTASASMAHFASMATVPALAAATRVSITKRQRQDHMLAHMTPTS